jgi:DNA-binding transcriptional ArsR family regulator
MTEDRLQSDQCAEKLRALGEPLRLRIVDCLRAGPMTVGQVCTALDTEMVTVSHHLGILKNCGIVTREKQGRYAVYSLCEGVIDAAGKRAENDHINLGCCRIEIPK